MADDFYRCQTCGSSTFTGRCTWCDTAREAATNPPTESVRLTDAEQQVIDGLFGYVPEPEPLEQMFAAVERIIAARLTAYAERARPVIRVEGVSQGLRAAALLDATTLGDAWDTIQPSIVPPPPWSYLRRFLHALADATCQDNMPELRGGDQ